MQPTIWITNILLDSVWFDSVWFDSVWFDNNIYILESTAQINSGDRSDQPLSGIRQEIQSISSPIGADNEQKLLFFLFEKSLKALVTRGCLKKIEIGRRFNTEVCFLS